MQFQTASIDFCEENYYITSNIAEFHNTWSSVLMIIPPVIGLFYSNPTHELRTSLLFGILILIFVGSTLLHSTLNSFEQSIDEVSMLILNNLLLYFALEYRNILCRSSTIYIIGLLTIIQIYIYYTFQHLYYIFLLQFIPLSVCIVFYLLYTLYIHNYNPLYNQLCFFATISYVFSGAPLWILEMNYCNTLIPYYRSIGGCTLHILWHFGSGIGAYLTILFLICIRLERLGGNPKLKWVFNGMCPVIVNKF